jgi:hypothetical protein
MFKPASFQIWISLFLKLQSWKDLLIKSNLNRIFLNFGDNVAPNQGLRRNQRISEEEIMKLYGVTYYPSFNMINWNIKCNYASVLTNFQRNLGGLGFFRVWGFWVLGFWGEGWG